MDIPEPKIEEAADAILRDFKITRQLLEKHGYSDNCKGCEAALFGTGARVHTHACRHRLEQAMLKETGGTERLKRRDERLHREDSGKPTPDDPKSQEAVDSPELGCIQTELDAAMGSEEDEELSLIHI